MNAKWVREIRDQCRLARVRFFFKQWGGVQKSKNGRILDDRTWDEMPRVRMPRSDAGSRRGGRTHLPVQA
jgi:protein gp37